MFASAEVASAPTRARQGPEVHRDLHSPHFGSLAVVMQPGGPDDAVEHSLNSTCTPAARKPGGIPNSRRSSAALSSSGLFVAALSILGSMGSACGERWQPTGTACTGSFTWCESLFPTLLCSKAGLAKTEDCELRWCTCLCAHVCTPRGQTSQ